MNDSQNINLYEFYIIEKTSYSIIMVQTQARYKQKTALFIVSTSTGKERDSETGFSYFGARYYDSDLMTGWLSVDPMSDKYPNLSPYNYCAWNPVKLVDPDGRMIGDYYNKDGKWLYNDGRNDGKIYVEDVENGMYMGPFLQPMYRMAGIITSISLDFIGEASTHINSKNNEVSLSEGKLIMSQHCDDGNTYTRFSLDAVSGHYGAGSLENGNYIVEKGWRRSEKGYVKHGFGFSFPLIPTFETKRSDLRIHPDGNTFGTLGCIGIDGTLFQLEDFYNTLNANISQFGCIPLFVDIKNNVNNNGELKININGINE